MTTAGSEFSGHYPWRRHAERPPLINVSLLRPDGKEIRLLRHAVRTRKGNKAPTNAIPPNPLRIQLSTDESTIGGVQEFRADEFDHADTRSLRGVVDRALVRQPRIHWPARG
ncbi:MAG: hypothetical protein R2867_38635 [Caldilineaceae bacterium]